MNHKAFRIRGKFVNKETRMLLAAEKRRKAMVEKLINTGVNINYSHGRYNYTVLHYASQNGWLDIVKSLLRKGADIQVKTEKGESSLFIAAENGHSDVFEFLLDAGADLNCYTMLNSSFTILHFATEWGWLEIVRILLKRGFDVHGKAAGGESPLLRAAENGRKDVVELLVNAGADINFYKVESNYTMLHYAAKYGWVEMIQFLLNKGFNIEAKSNKGETPIQCACNCYKGEAVKYLISAGADVNVESNDGKTPLYFPIKLLRDFDFSRPLDIIMHGIRAIVPLLINSGMYIKPVDYKIILQNSVWKEYILKDIELCSQAIINEFNHKDLPELYKFPMACKILPGIEKMRILNNSPVAHEVLQCVKHEVQVKGHCNVLEVRPNNLKILAVKSFLSYCQSIKNRILLQIK